MVIDTSAVLAILLVEPEGASFGELIESAAEPLVSSVSVLEMTIAIGTRKQQAGLSALEIFLRDSWIRVVPFDTVQLRLAREAWMIYGKGRHRARLNFGDCCTYALAKMTGRPLLFKGDDFNHTDLTPVL